MELFKALQTIITKHGKEIIRKEVLANFLSDYHAYELKPTRIVMKTFLKMGYGEKIFFLDQNNIPDKLLKIHSYANEMVNNHGFQEVHVNYIIESFCFALGWVKDTPKSIITDNVDEIVIKKSINVSGITFSMNYVQGGVFDMGGTPEQGLFAAFDEKPSVQVTLNSFFLSETPVTQALWTAIMLDNPSHFKGDNLPVERVSWEDCQEFIKRLNIQTGMKFRLPTEAEWEYAARGGQYSKHQKYAGANDDAKSDYIWLKENSQSQSHEVKTKLPNELGLFDMSGNISEWCSDWYFNSYANNGERVNPKGPVSGVAKVYRGGSWDDKPMNCRVSKRFSMNPIFKNKLVGMRLAATNI